MLVLWRERSRWTVLIAACWVEATAGLSYVFSTYSSSLKSQLGYDQRHINRLSVAKDLGDTVGLIAGFLCKVLPNWTILLLGALFIFVGYGLLWLLTDHRIPILPFWLGFILAKWVFMFFAKAGKLLLDFWNCAQVHGWVEHFSYWLRYWALCTIRYMKNSGSQSSTCTHIFVLLSGNPSIVAGS